MVQDNTTACGMQTRSIDCLSMTEPAEPRVSADKIASFLQQTGFVFEMRANEVLVKAGYATELNEYFLDLEGNQKREIDITASKLVNDINLHFIVECKQSSTDKWIFICKKKTPRFYRAVKHLPVVSTEILKDKNLFGGFHSFDRKTALAHNYLASFKGEKKAEHLQIDECIQKLPKALVDFASRASGERHLFFPVALFAGQIFAASYQGKLLVEETPFLQYYSEFKKDAYSVQPEVPGVESRGVPIWAYRGRMVEQRQKRIRNVAEDLAPPYQIDFVTETGFFNYLSMIEKMVSSVRISDWGINESSRLENATQPFPK